MTVIHKAGPWNTATWEQRCTECDAVLAHQPKTAEGLSLAMTIGPYPEGSLIERGALYQAMSLRAQEPTCTEGEPDDRPKHRLTRQERLQGLADSGIDTWEEYRGEK